MKRILYYLGLVDLVWTIDHDGETRLRIVWHGADGEKYVYGICGPSFDVYEVYKLLPDGILKKSPTYSYVERWCPYHEGRPKPKVKNNAYDLTPWKPRKPFNSND